MQAFNAASTITASSFSLLSSSLISGNGIMSYLPLLQARNCERNPEFWVILCECEYRVELEDIHSEYWVLVRLQHEPGNIHCLPVCHCRGEHHFCVHSHNAQIRL